MTASQESVAPTRWPGSAGLLSGILDLWRLKHRLGQFLSWSYLFAPVDTASLAMVRIAMGALVAIDAVRKGQEFFYPSGGVLQFSFRYQFFHWVHEAPELSVYLPYVMFIAGIATAIGLFYRFFSVLSLLLVSYGFLLNADDYLNHYYMLIIALLLLAVSPAHRSLSVDRLLFFRGSAVFAPRIYLVLFKAQIEIILIHAGLVKINSDWLRLEPLRTWLLERQDRTFFGFLFESDFMVAVAAYGTILLHLVGAPLLFFRQTRLAVFLIYCAFHITNHFVFEIGIFPWMTMVCTTLFFAPDWPRSAFASLWPGRSWTPPEPEARPMDPKSFGNRALVAFFFGWLIFQTLFPLRHVLYPGWVEWTHEGHRFAWRMKLTDHSSPGMLLAVHVPERKRIHIPDLPRYMSQMQYLMVSTRPDLTQQLAWQLAHLYRHNLKVSDVRVFAYVLMTMNNRRPALVMDPAVDLAATRSAIWHDPWVTMTNPNPLRRIEQVKADPPEMRLTIRQVLARMGLPEPQDCVLGSTSTPNLHDVAVCSLDGGNEWSTQW